MKYAHTVCDLCVCVRLRKIKGIGMRVVCAMRDQNSLSFSVVPMLTIKEKKKRREGEKGNTLLAS